MPCLADHLFHMFPFQAEYLMEVLHGRVERLLNGLSEDVNDEVDSVCMMVVDEMTKDMPRANHD